MSETEPPKLLFLPGEVTRFENCHDVVESLVKYPGNPVMTSEYPWEGDGVFYPSVLYDVEEKLFKMWYYTTTTVLGSRTPDGREIDNAAVYGRSFLCYAVSEDGIRWEKPFLGLFNFLGSKDNNILFTDAGFLFGCAPVILNHEDPNPERRFKMLFYDNDGAGRDGIRTATSKDGLHWTIAPDFPVLPSQDTPGLWHDRQRGVYVAFLKERIRNQRARMISESTDFETWSTPSLHLAPDAGDRPTVEYYSQGAFAHHGHNLGFLTRYDLVTQKLDLELIYNPGGSDWKHFPSRPQILGPGDPGAWDGGMVLNGLGEPIRVGNEYIYHYYGCAALHSSGGGTAGVGIASFQDGRIAGQQFVGEGWFCSLPFRCPGGRLHINAVSTEPLTVEVRGAGYLDVLDGYTRGDCVPVQGDSQTHEIVWKDKADLDTFEGQFIKLCVYGKNARVYGASFA